MNYKLFCIKNVVPYQLSSLLKHKRVRAINLHHRSGDYIYDIDNEYILKISKDKKRTKKEKEINDYLSLKLPVSKSVLYIEDDKYAYYLKTKVIGTPLSRVKYLKDPKKLAKLLGNAVKMFHNVDASDCPFDNDYSVGNTLIHGDFCLPNILAVNNKITGFIDTSSSGKGDKYVDYAWCIWSFEYNLGTNEYTHLLLKELNIENERDKMDKYLEI